MYVCFWNFTNIYVYKYVCVYAISLMALTGMYVCMYVCMYKQVVPKNKHKNVVYNVH